jgi:hypothetical protein
MFSFLHFSSSTLHPCKDRKHTHENELYSLNLNEIHEGIVTCIKYRCDVNKKLACEKKSQASLKKKSNYFFA